tara:strand:- start:9575 stop:12316 length:2742 start_codon:yes stop_codon:yes gene_type:complete
MSGGDAKFFTSHKRGEVAEWREEINSTDKDVQKNAIKRIIANMSIGKDVSMLFPDVVNRAQTNDVELKKLVYLYLLNYARSQPELTILAVNTFVKDSADPNPLIRALAVRTMGCIRVEKITEYLCDPLQRTLVDEDPYVRKTAAICVAKLHDINPELVEDRGFIDQLKELLADSNPMVVANAVAALTEIRDASASPGNIFNLNTNNVYKLLAALNECTEWGQVFILDSLASYKPSDEQDASSVIERVTPRLQHANCAVVLSAVKVIISQMSFIGNEETTKGLIKKLAPPLVTLLSAESEIQYVALRNINLITQKYPNMLTGEIKVFFCKYNDPIYVKQEKLETMVKLACEQNIDMVLLEFKEYATEVDVDFVRKSVRAIGRCAISIEAAAERCVSILLELIGTKVNYVVQEAIVVIKDIFRRYPNQYEGVIGVLCDSLDTLDEPEAKASMVWIIGEYAERIDNAEELLEAFLDTFLEEAPEVQLQLLTATVKLFLKKPSSGPQALIQTVLNQATAETDDPDLRDRAYVYWRLLSSDPEAAKDVVLATKPTIKDDRNLLDPDLLQELLRQISTLSSVYHKLPSTFVPNTRVHHSSGGETSTDGVGLDNGNGIQETSGSLVDVGQLGSNPVAAPATSGVDLLADLMGGTAVTNAPAPVASTSVLDAFDMGMGVSSQSAPVAGPAQNLLLTAEKGDGLQISGVVIAGPAGSPVYDLTFTNQTQTPLEGFQLQFNKNAFSLVPAQQPAVGVVAPGGSARCSLQLANTGQSSGSAASHVLQVAVKSPSQNNAVFYFSDVLPLESLLLPDAVVAADVFSQQWQWIPEISRQIPCAMSDVAAATSRLQNLKWHLVTQQAMPGTLYTAIYVSGKMPGPEREQTLLVQVVFAPGAQEVKVAVRSHVQGFADMVFASLQRALA